MKEMAEFIRQGESFAVISHISPDGDTMGSAAALLYGLKKLGKHGQWFCEGEVPADFMKIEQIASLVQGEKYKDFDTVLCVDISAEDRMGTCKALYDRIPRKGQIDHHVTNTHYAQVNLVDARNAAAFVVMDLLDELNVPLDDDIARALFVGISTDTGRLSHADVSERDVAQTARLYAHNIRVNETVGILFQTASLKRTKLKGRAIEHLTSLFDGKLTWTYLDLEDYAAFDADSSDSEGIVEVCRCVDGTLAAAFLRQTREGYKISMRCVPGMDVSKIAMRFGGGGHVLAAGCNLTGDREAVQSAILQAMQEEFGWKA